MPGAFRRPFVDRLQVFDDALPIIFDAGLGVNDLHPGELVPPGEFEMGRPMGETSLLVQECRKRELPGVPLDCDVFENAPRHTVRLDGFYIDRYEVTNASYERFVRAAGYRTTAEREGRGFVVDRKGDRQEGSDIGGATWQAPSGPGSRAEPGHTGRGWTAIPVG